MVIILNIELEITKPIKWRAWKGTFCGKVIYDSISNEDVVASFRTIPPDKMKPELKAGDTVIVRAVIWGPHSEGLASDVSIGLLNLDYAIPINVELKEVKIGRPPEIDENMEPVAFYFKALHYPTFYKFHGSWVSLPSFPRMLNSLLKRIGEELENEFDKDLIDRLTTKIEPIGGNLRIARERVKGGLEVPTFSGSVKYYGVVDRGEIEFLKWALRYLPLFGAGASPGLGFGHVQLVEINEPPFNTPVEKYSENEKYEFNDFLK